MRCAAGLLLLATLPGCSLFIRGSAPTYEGLDTREIVYDTFGPPDYIAEEGFLDPNENTVRWFQVEHHHVRRRFNTEFPIGFGLPGVFLLMEPYSTTMALYEVTQDYTKGHDIAFVYDDEGTTIGFDYPQPFLQSAQYNGINVLRWQRADKPIDQTDPDILFNSAATPSATDTPDSPVLNESVNVALQSSAS